MKLQNFIQKYFFADMDKLHIERPEIIAKATEHIPDMLEFVKEIIKMDMLMKQVQQFILMYPNLINIQYYQIETLKNK